MSKYEGLYFCNCHFLGSVICVMYVICNMWISLRSCFSSGNYVQVASLLMCISHCVTVVGPPKLYGLCVLEQLLLHVSMLPTIESMCFSYRSPLQLWTCANPPHLFACVNHFVDTVVTWRVSAHMFRALSNIETSLAPQGNSTACSHLGPTVSSPIWTSC